MTVEEEPLASLGKEPIIRRSRRTPEQRRAHFEAMLKGVANDEAKRVKRFLQEAQIVLGKAAVHAKGQPYLAGIETALKQLQTAEAQVKVNLPQ